MPPKLAAVTHWPKLALACHYSVSRIADRCGVSVSELRSFFRHQVGWGPKRWLRELRLAQAELWLAAGRSTQEVAAGLHYTDAAHFCREFKQARRMRPRKWLAWCRWVWNVSGGETVFTPVPLPRPRPQAARVFPNERDFPWLRALKYCPPRQRTGPVQNLMGWRASPAVAKRLGVR